MKKPGIALLLLACLLLCAAGCGKKKNAYDRAGALLEASSFAQAEELFSSLGDYGDAADQTRECKYLLAKSYAQAQPSDVVQAVHLLNEIGAYKDAIALKAALQEQYFYAEYDRRVPCVECVMTDARRSEDDGEDTSGSFHRYSYTWDASGSASVYEMSDRFMQWIAYLDSADGVTTEPSLNGTYFICADGERVGVISSQKTDTTVGVTVVLYDKPMA